MACQFGARCAAKAATLAVALAAATATNVEAHPHVWVSVETAVDFDRGTIVGVTQRWTFDELYTTMAVQGLDKNKDGKLDREELKELAEVNMDGLKEFGYFTHMRIGDKALKIAPPKDYWLEHTNGVLSLVFKLPLAQPVLAEAKDFNFATYDNTFFIAFELAKENAIKLAGDVPAGCAFEVKKGEGNSKEAEALGEAFFAALQGGQFGSGLAASVAVTCGGEKPPEAKR